MAQQTTEEFAFRLAQAVEGHPLAPPGNHGRVTWLMRELEARMGVKVSLNTVHKWMTGASRPREDRVRDLAKLLKVDEIWLAFGKNPATTPAKAQEHAVNANGATMAVAGLIELCGGRVTFPSPTPGKTATIQANIGGRDLGIIAIAPQVGPDSLSLVVPEPSGTNRVIAVICPERFGPSVRHFELVDITDIGRQHFGGFSVLELKRGKDGLLKLPNSRKTLPTMDAITELATA